MLFANFLNGMTLISHPHQSIASCKIMVVGAKRGESHRYAEMHCGMGGELKEFFLLVCLFTPSQCLACYLLDFSHVASFGELN